MAQENIDRANEADSLIMEVAEAAADADRENDSRAADLLLINGYMDKAAFRWLSQREP